MMSKAPQALIIQRFILPFKQGVRGSNPRWVTNKKPWNFNGSRVFLFVFAEYFTSKNIEK